MNIKAELFNLVDVLKYCLVKEKTKFSNSVHNLCISIQNIFLELKLEKRCVQTTLMIFKTITVATSSDRKFYWTAGTFIVPVLFAPCPQISWELTIKLEGKIGEIKINFSYNQIKTQKTF